jgi:preprotein translocase subunit SecG
VGLGRIYLFKLIKLFRDNLMESILLVIHVIVALLIVGLIMLQQGKGAEMGASFGSGGSQTVFGAAGTGNFFSRLTAIFVAIFFATSFTLAMLAQDRVEVEEPSIPVLETSIDEIPGTSTELDTDSILESHEDEIPAADQAVPEVIEAPAVEEKTEG